MSRMTFARAALLLAGLGIAASAAAGVDEPGFALRLGLGTLVAMASRLWTARARFERLERVLGARGPGGGA